MLAASCPPHYLPCSLLPSPQASDSSTSLQRNPFPRSLSLFLTSLSSHHYEFMLDHFGPRETVDGTTVALHR